MRRTKSKSARLNAQRLRLMELLLEIKSLDLVAYMELRNEVLTAAGKLVQS